MPLARRHERRPEMLARGAQCESCPRFPAPTEGTLRGKPSAPPRRLRKGAETCGERGARRRKRQEAQRRFGNDAEQPFRSDKKADQIKPGFVFVRASSGAQHVAV